MQNRKNLRPVEKISAADLFYEKPLPFEAEAERSILGAILLDNDVINQAQDLVKVDAFRLDAHRHIYKTLLDLASEGSSLDGVTLGSRLRAKGIMETVGGMTYVASLIDGVPRTDNIAPYAKLVNRAYLSRMLITHAYNWQAAAFDGELEPEEILAKAQEVLYGLTGTVDKRQAEQVGSIGDRVIGQIQARSEGKLRLLGVPSGLDKIDDRLLGFQEGLTLICARPSHGKTSLASAIGLFAAEKNNNKVLDFSLEMSAEKRVWRLLAMLARVDSTRLKMGFLSTEEWARLGDAFSKLQAINYAIDDTPGLTIPEMRARARRHKQVTGLDLMVVDYVGLMQTIKQGSQDEQGKEISNGLVSIAKELHIPVIALIQLNRNCEHREDKHPLLSDLRESGNYEQDADVVISLCNQGMYYPDEPTLQGVTDCEILKNRDGWTGRFQLAFIPEYTKFENLWQGQ